MSLCVLLLSFLVKNKLLKLPLNISLLSGYYLLFSPLIFFVFLTIFFFFSSPPSISFYFLSAQAYYCWGEWENCRVTLMKGLHTYPTHSSLFMSLLKSLFSDVGDSADKTRIIAMASQKQVYFFPSLFSFFFF